MSGGGAGVQVADGGLGLLGHDTVPEGLELLGAGEAGDVGDVAGVEAHEPLDEGGAQAIASVSCPGGGSSEDGLPAGDGGGETAPVSVGFPRPNVLLVLSPSARVGVGRRFTATSFSGLAFVPIRFDSPDFQSRAAGVGSSVTVVRRSSPPSPCVPAPFVSEVRGVGRSGEEDEPAPLVGSADLRRRYNAPLRIEPDCGKVGEDGVESQSKVTCDVLKDRESGS